MDGDVDRIAYCTAGILTPCPRFSAPGRRPRTTRSRVSTSRVDTFVLALLVQQCTPTAPSPEDDDVLFATTLFPLVFSFSLAPSFLVVVVPTPVVTLSLFLGVICFPFFPAAALPPLATPPPPFFLSFPCLPCFALTCTLLIFLFVVFFIPLPPSLPSFLPFLSLSLSLTPPLSVSLSAPLSPPLRTSSTRPLRNPPPAAQKRARTTSRRKTTSV